MHDTARLTEAFRRAVLRLFVRLKLFDADRAANAVSYRSDKSEGPTAGTETVDRRSSSPESWCTSPPRATLLQQIFEVGPLACPSRQSPMRIVACVTQTSVIDRILTRRATADHRTP